ncbi:DinB family protein [Bacillus sp. 2205SS5-2]|uniref:DinB family protein n=1 Tax=Bacillus sp. 2205SS5-2 TaxID=3109031 RepID=UPI003004ADB5
MNFNISEAMEILERTPQSLKYLLSGLSEEWLETNEGEGTWTVIEVIDHLIEAEKTNWIPRIEMILNEDSDSVFPPFDRFSHLKDHLESTLEQKFMKFKALRKRNLQVLKELIDQEINFEHRAIHPALGVVTLRELLSTWVVHDLTHTSQIVRVMAMRYSDDVGPWKEYLRILK